VAWRVLDAKFFGTPQRRRRVFLVASYRSPSAAQVLFDDRPTAIITRSRPSEEQKYSARLRRGHSSSNLYTIQHASIGRHDKAGPQAKGYRNDGETWTLDSRGSADALCETYDAFRIRESPRFSSGMDGTTGGVDGATGETDGTGGTNGGGGGTNGRNGRVNIKEVDSSRYRCVGNAVAVPVIEWIGRRIMGIETGALDVEPFVTLAEFFCHEEMPSQLSLFAH
jgi:DNA (cytosine-5)-methyltransferase 1